MITPLQQLNDTLFEEKQVRVFIKRDDLIHPQISGNKWRKLKYNLKAAKEQGHHKLLTFGGAYSNHIYAVAAAGKASGFETIGIIRGEKVLPLNQTLTFASEQGMQLQFISREEYKQKEKDDFIDALRREFGNFYLLPEGGTNTLAVKGCSEIVDEITIDCDYLCCACGTGGTLAGLIAGANGKNKVLGFSALKGMNELDQKITTLVNNLSGKTYSNWLVNHNFHFGGYAKMPEELQLFIQGFHSKHSILLDPVYNSKMMFGIYDLIKNNFFERDTAIVALHTGGLQGWNGFIK
ncbi:MAG: 1-aminocyclopropane-1-carboxylate deaminase/D-cysteine desulfhydrase [Chitinophagaceae bacterium]|nr:1-aminocyclopropane-1-carboxylate deaminase/D-cysteine desulfhydrase [Chitinophagaceae bacterium]